MPTSSLFKTKSKEKAKIKEKAKEKSTKEEVLKQKIKPKPVDIQGIEGAEPIKHTEQLTTTLKKVEKRC